MAVEKPIQHWLVCVFGLPGSGKTTVCSSLREKLPDCVEYDFDDAMPLAYRDKMAQGETLSFEEREQLMSLVISGWQERLAKHICVVSASMLVKEVHRQRIRDAIRSVPGQDVLFIHMDAPVDSLLSRLSGRAEHFADERVLRALAQQHEPIAVPHHVIDASLPASECLSEAARIVHMETGLSL